MPEWIGRWNWLPSFASAQLPEGPRRMVGLGAWCLAVSGLLSLAIAGGTPGVGAGGGLVAAVGWITARRLKVDLLDAPGLYAVMAIALFGVTSLAWLGTPPGRGPNLEPDAISQALLLVAGGLAAFGLMSRLVAGPAVRRPPLTFRSESAPSAGDIVGLFSIGLLGTAVGLAVGTYGYGSTLRSPGELQSFAQLISETADIGPVVVLATALIYFGTGAQQYRRLLYTLVAVQVLVGFLAGFKGYSVYPIVFVLLAYVACRCRIPWRVVGILATLTVFVLIPGNLFYRAIVRSNSTEMDGVVFSDTRADILAGIPEETYNYVLTRFRMIDSVALVVDQTPSVYAYAHGSLYLTVPYLILVPRAIWPDKPIVNQGVEFSHTYMQLPHYVKTSTPITQPGDLYRNFGAAGVGIGALFWGAVVGAAGAACRRWRSPRVEMVYLVFLIHVVAPVELALPSIVVGAAKSLPFVLLVAWLMLPGRTGEPGSRELRQRLGTRIARLRGLAHPPAKP